MIFGREHSETEEKTVLAVKNEGKNGHKFHDTVARNFSFRV